MRVLTAVLFTLGAVLLAVGLFYGLGELFAWNGRHAVLSRPVDEGLTRETLHAVGGRRYTISVQAVFDRAAAPAQEGVVTLEAKLPITVSVKDGAGTSLAAVIGWLDADRPNVLHGATVTAHAGELALERVVGPFTAASDAPYAVEVDVGHDRVGAVPVTMRRLVIYDDVLPPTIRNGFIAAAAGAIALFVSLGMALVGFLRRRARRKRRAGRGMRASDVV